MAEHNDIGKWGEAMARDYLVSQGYSIVAQNHKCGGVEIDIIASKGADMAFVEVKTRKDGDLDPATAATPLRLRRMARGIDLYIAAHDVKADPRIDIIAVVGSPATGILRLEHYPDAYLPGSSVSISPRILPD